MHVVYKMCYLIINLVSISIVDLLTVDPHTPTPEPVQFDKKDGQWYGHDGVDVKDTQERKGNRELLHRVCMPILQRLFLSGNIHSTH